MKDAYSCDRDEAGLDASYQAQYEAYTRIFERLGLDTVAVGADVGIMGGTGAHEFMFLNRFGEDTLVLCESCGYAANQQIAVVGKPDPGRGGRCRWRRSRPPAPRPSTTLATFLDIGPQRTAKAAFFMTGDGRFVVGDRPRRLRRQRDQARQRGQGDRRPPPGDGRGDQGGGHGARLRLADRRARRGRRRGRARRRAPRTSSPARTAPASTCAT